MNSLLERRLKDSTWSDVSRLASSDMLRASTIWVVMVPILVNALPDDPSLKVDLGGGEFEVSLVLPFSWQLLYLGSLFSVAGNVAYSFYCPSFVKEYSDLQEYKRKGRGGAHLFKLLQNSLKQLKNCRPEDLEENLIPFMVLYKKLRGSHDYSFADAIKDLDETEHSIGNWRETITHGATFNGVVGNEQSESVLFWWLRDMSEHYAPGMRKLSLVACLVAYAIFVFVMSEGAIRTLIYIVRGLVESIA